MHEPRKRTALDGKTEIMTEREIEIVMNALAGNPTLTTSEFADKIERILREYKEEDDDE